MVDTKSAQPLAAGTTDIPAEVAELRRTVTALEADRDSALGLVAGLTDRIAALETKPAGSGGVNSAAVERELGKLRRPLVEVISSYFRNTVVEPAEALDPVPVEPVKAVESGSGSTVGATSTANN